MVTYQEWLNANEFTVFENIDNHKRITKYFLKDNLARIEKHMMQQYADKGEGPTTENVHRIQDLIAATLENFEIVDIKTVKQIYEGIPIAENAAIHVKSTSNKGDYCYKCGLQKQDTKIVHKGDRVIRMCKECLGI